MLMTSEIPIAHELRRKQFEWEKKNNARGLCRRMRPRLASLRLASLRYLAASERSSFAVDSPCPGSVLEA